MQPKQIRAVMVARVAVASAKMLHLRRSAFERKHVELRALHASGAETHLVERVEADIKAMAHPIWDFYSLCKIRWKRGYLPKTKELAEKWDSAIERGILPKGAYVFAGRGKAGSAMLVTGDHIGIAFTE